MDRPPRLAYFSPLPPERSGVSDYSRDLLPHLAPRAEIDLYIDDYTPTDTGITWTFPIWNYREYPWRREYRPYDCALYHLGNNRMHRYLYPFVFAAPGIVVLHDLVLHHMLAGMAVEADGAGVYLREMAYAAGARGVRTGWEVVTGERPAPFFEYPLCQRAIESSLGVIVHSDYLSREVGRLCLDVPVRQVPMGIPLPDRAAFGILPDERHRVRRRLELPEDAFIVGSLGEATQHKRLHIVFRAFARLLASRPDAWLVIAGSVAPGLNLSGLAETLGITHRVNITGVVPREEFEGLLQAVDVCVNLRYPTAGETSASALRSLAAGQATVISAVGANNEIPDGCCVRLPVEADEEHLLTALLERLHDDPLLRTRLGAFGREYIAKHHRPVDSAAGYVRFVHEITGRPYRASVAFRTADDETARLRESPSLRHAVSALRDLGIGPNDIILLETVAQRAAALGFWSPGGSEVDGGIP